MFRTILIAGLLTATGAAAQDTARTQANLQTATVYFGYGAELTHDAKVTISKNTRYIVIDALSTEVDVNSLQISVPENVALMSHRFSIYTPPHVPQPKSKELLSKEDSLSMMNKEMSRIDNQIVIEQEVMTKTGDLIEATLKNNGTKTVSSEDVLKLVNHYTGKIEKAKNAIWTYNQQKSELHTRISELRQRIAVIPGQVTTNGKALGQLVLQVMSTLTGEIPVSLSYYTNNAGWTPMYDIRVNSKTNKVKLVYKAALTQTTGIDWKKTKLTLSTGTPVTGVAAPILSAWYLQLYVPEMYNALQNRAAGLANTRNFVQSMNKGLDEVVVTGYANDFKLEDKKVEPSTIQQYTTLNEGQLNTNFEIDLPYDIASDGQLHNVTIKDEEIACVLKNYAVPRIDKEAYLMAEVADWQNLDLLPGDANIIMDDTYIGKSVIDPISTADTLNLSLGRDKRLVVKRSLLKEQSSLKTSGGQNRQSFTYEIMVKNNKLTDVNMLLKDQFPLSSIKEVEVKLEDDGGAMINNEAGVLTWMVNLKPGESKKFRFTYTVKYPKDKKIVNLK